MAIGTGDGSFAELFIAPNHFARFEILADPSFVIGIAIKIFSDEHDAAVMIHHHFVGVDLVGIEGVATRRDFE